MGLEAGPYYFPLLFIKYMYYCKYSIEGTSCTVADLGGCSWGQLPPPLHGENSAWRPIFDKKGAPYPDPNALYFLCFVLNLGNI